MKRIQGVWYLIYWSLIVIKSRGDDGFIVIEIYVIIILSARDKISFIVPLLFSFNFSTIAGIMRMIFTNFSRNLLRISTFYLLLKKEIDVSSKGKSKSLRGKWKSLTSFNGEYGNIPRRNTIICREQSKNVNRFRAKQRAFPFIFPQKMISIFNLLIESPPLKYFSSNGKRKKKEKSFVF